MSHPPIRRSAHYTVAEVAQIMGVDEESVRRWIREGGLQAWSTGRGWGKGYRIDHDELERHVSERYPYLRLALDDRKKPRRRGNVPGPDTEGPSNRARQR